MNKQIAFLVTPSDAQDDPTNDNIHRLPQAFREMGWQVHVCAHETMQMHQNTVRIGSIPAIDFDLIWPVGFGRKGSFFDRLQILSQLPARRLITNPAAYVAMHGKAALMQYGPATFISSQVDELSAYLEANAGDWVIKPLAGSYGRDVCRIRDLADLHEALNNSESTGYWMLQEYLPGIEVGETRTLVCGAQIIGSYLRTPTDGLHANLAVDATAATTTLTTQDAITVTQVHQRLAEEGVGFAAIDTVDGKLMEINIANPGGLATLQRLYTSDPTPAVVTSVEQLIEDRASTS